MKTIWNGALAFGMVHIPVGLTSATESETGVKFRILHKGCNEPIKQKRVCPHHDVELGPDEIVKGWEFSKGAFVMVDDAELEALNRERSAVIEIDHFVDVSEVNPVYLSKPYYLAPSKVTVAARSYAVLLRALLQTGAAGVGEVVLRGKPHWVLVRADADHLVLTLTVLRYGEDVRAPGQHEFSDLIEPHFEAVDEALLSMALQAVEAMREPFEPRKTSGYREDVTAMLQAKMAGETFVPEEPAEVETTTDIYEAMRLTTLLAQQKKAA